jgi:hypothetical protein
MWIRNTGKKWLPVGRSCIEILVEKAPGRDIESAGENFLENVIWVIVACAFDISSANKTWCPLLLGAGHHRRWDLSREKKRAGPILSLFTR